MTPNAANLMRRFDFEHWPRPGSNDTKVFVWRLTLGPQALSEWTSLRVQQEALEHDCLYTTSIWKPNSGDGLLRLDVYEEPSRLDAELRLLNLLAGFQSPRVHRDSNAKYPLFRFGQDASLAFSRGNLTFFAANAERTIVSLKNVTRIVDWLFAASLPQSKAIFLPILNVKEPGSARLRASVPLTVDAEYPAPIWYRIETTLGEVHREGSRIIYQSHNKGTETLKVTAVGIDGNASRIDRTFTVVDDK